MFFPPFLIHGSWENDAIEFHLVNKLVKIFDKALLWLTIRSYSVIALLERFFKIRIPFAVCYLSMTVTEKLLFFAITNSA